MAFPQVRDRHGKMNPNHIIILSGNTMEDDDDDDDGDDQRGSSFT